MSSFAFFQVTLREVGRMGEAEAINVTYVCTIVTAHFSFGFKFLPFPSCVEENEDG